MSLSKRKKDNEELGNVRKKHEIEKRVCCAQGCKNEYNMYNFFKFPETKKVLKGKAVKCYRSVCRYKKWLKNCGCEKSDGKEKNKSDDHDHVLCSAHFCKEASIGDDRKHLKCDAIPTLFGDDVLKDTFCGSKGMVEEKTYFGDHSYSLESRGVPMRRNDNDIASTSHDDYDVSMEAADGDDINLRKADKRCSITDNLTEHETQRHSNVSKKCDHTYSKKGIAEQKKDSIKQKELKLCCVKGCDSSSVNHNMLKFPNVTLKKNGNMCIQKKNLVRFKKWVFACGMSHLLLMSPISVYQKYFVCDQHFKDADFMNSIRNKISYSAYPTLKISNIECDLLINNYEKNLKKWEDKNCDDKVFCSEDSSAFAFEEDMKSLTWKTCEGCKEKSLVSSLKKHFKCQHGAKCWEYSENNNMDPGNIPDELKNLTFVEQSLISLIHPMITVFQLKGHQYGYKGNVISFPQNVQQLANQLPHAVSDLQITTVRYDNDQGQYHEFQVRREKVRTAIEWLQKNNPHYKNVKMNEGNVRDLPEDGNVCEQLHEIRTKNRTAEKEYEDDIQNVDDVQCDDVGHSGVPNMIPRHQDECVREKLRWPSIGTEPLKEKETPGLFACSFPCLFPYGVADINDERIEEVKTFNYIKHLLKYSDDRFAKHLTFRFFAYNFWMRWAAMSDGHLFVKKNSEFQEMTVAELKELVKENENLVKQMMYYGSNLKGTKAYWYARGNELKNMVEQLGLPTIFLTLSCADGHWDGLYKLLSDQDPKTLTEAERRKLVKENPHIVDSYFAYRVESFIQNVLKTQYNVIDYWYRVEYQHRGSPHIHGVFWIENAPDVSYIEHLSEQEIEKIISYFSNLVEAWNPNVNCEPPDVHPCRKTYENIENFQEDLAQLLHKVQRHTKCSEKYCFKMNKKTKKRECRFKFPKDMQNEATIEKGDNGEYEFKEKRNDPKLNKFNKFLIQLWRANIDIAPVISKHALLCYLTKYISKCETQSETLKGLFANVTSNLENEANAKKAVHKLFMKSCAERDVSAQEVMHVMLCNKFYSAGGRSFVHINMSEKKWVKLKEDEENSCNGKDILTKYAERPDRLQQISLWNACKLYNSQRWNLVKKENIVCIYPKTTKEQGEIFFRQNVLLHVPWRTESDVKLDTESWETVYRRYNVESLVEETNRLITNKNETMDADYETDSENNSDEDFLEEHLASRLGPKQDIPKIDLGNRQVDLNFNWHERFKFYEQYGNMPFFTNFVDNMKQNYRDKASPVNPLNSTFSPDQQEVIDLISNQIHQLQTNGNTKNLVKRFIIQGKAGTGKSFLITYITSLLNEKLGKDSYLLGAPTGVSAVLINGKTIHSLLKIPIDSKDFKLLTGPAERTLCNHFTNVKFLILDEYSMIGCKKLAMISKRCQQGTGNYEEDFGGLNVLLLGDLKQLPPVFDIEFFRKSPKGFLAQEGKQLIDNFQKAFVLSTCHRQQDKKFLETLDMLSDGQTSRDGYEMFASRFTNTLSLLEQKQFENAMHLFSYKDDVFNYNAKKLRDLKDETTGLEAPVAKIKAKNSGHNGKLQSSTNAQNLENTLYLAQGCHIMLRKNLWVEAKLCNGTMGKVVDILYENDNDFPTVILCEFEDYIGPSIIPGRKIVPITPHLAKWTSDKNIEYTRYQFPIVLSYGCTIHKSQGMTLKKVVINLGDYDFATGLSYVALSRVKCLQDMMIEPFTKSRLKPSAHVQRTLEIRNDFLKNLQHRS